MATVAACRTCGAEPLQNARFCHNCGAPLEETATHAEYKQVTVLFADVVRSMDIASAVGAERLREIMADLVNLATAVVQRYGGMVDKFTGDGVMAVFGAPMGLEDHAVRACYAALDIQANSVELATQVKKLDGVDLQLRVGLNSGQVIAGEIGSRAFGYTTVGEQVGIAQRMESVAPPGGVTVSESTARLVKHAAVLSETEMVIVKGAAAPLPARRLLAKKSHRGPHGRVEAKLVGRQAQITALTEFLDRSITGHGGVVDVVGDAGIGKSSLVRELAAIADTHGVNVFWTFCESLANEIPLHVASSLLRARVGLGELDGAAARVHAHAQFPGADPEDLLLLDDLLSIADPRVAPPHIDPDARRRRLTAMVTGAWLARDTRAVFVIEDAHWIDHASESMLADLLAVVPKTPTMMVITYRPDYRGALSQTAGAQTITLSPLGNSEMAALTTELLGGDSSVDELATVVADRASGNPFFAEEIVRDLAERDVLVGERGAYVCRGDAAEVSVPATLHAAIAARLDRLEPKAKRTLSAAAVIGSRFDLDLLTALQAQPALDEPVKAELIDKVAGGPRAEFAFHHPLIRAVAYESQLKSDRAELHRRLAHVIEARDPTSVDQNAALIAEHVQAAGDVAGAYGWHMRAGTWFLQRDFVAAGRMWERARDLADMLPLDDAHRTAMRIAPRAMLCANAGRVHLPDSDAQFEELQALCMDADDKASWAFGMAGQLPMHMLHGRVREASQLASDFMTMVEAIDDPWLTVVLSFVAFPIALQTSGTADVMRWSQNAIDKARENPFLHPLMSVALAIRGTARWAEGQSGWRDDLDQAIAVARGADAMVHGYAVSVTYASAIAMGVLLPDDAAMADIDEALQVAERSSDDIALGLSRMTLGIALMHRDSPADRERGASMLTQVRQMCMDGSFYASERPLIEAYSARAEAAGKDRDDALPLMRKAVSDLFDTGQRAYCICATGILVETLLTSRALGDINEAASAIARLTIGAATEGAMLRDISLLRMRAQLAQARGDEDDYRQLAQRYRTVAASLAFEGHMAMAEAMTAPAGFAPISLPESSAMRTAGSAVPTGRIRRTMPLAGFAARSAGGRILAGLRERTGDADAVARFHDRNAERYSQLLGHSKGLLMKIGQIISMFDANTSDSMFSPYPAALASLQAGAPPMSADLAKDVVRADLGRSVEEVFDQFTEQPVAAASIGQVHRATLPDGREVAVKIQYPGVAEAIGDDLANHKLLTTIFQFLASASGNTMPDLRPAAREIATRIAEEIDYGHEAANIVAFGELYRGHPFIRIPDVIGEACGSRVLTMTYIDGQDWQEAQRADQDLKNTWAEVIARFMAGSFRHANLFHADPHPGNYRFLADGSVGILDFGCVKVLSESQRLKFVRMTRAAVDGDIHELRDLMVETGYLARGSTVTAEEAYEWWAKIVHELVAPQPFTYAHDAPTSAIRGMIDVRAEDHPARRMSMPEDFVLFPRLTIGMNTLFATLRATLDARSIYDDMDGVTQPVTPLGKQHHAWLRRRGLPCGLDAHDHP